MKMSKREKVLIIILALLIIVYGYYEYIYKNQISKINELKTQKVTLENKLNFLNNMIADLDKNESDFKILNSKIQDTSKILYPYISQEKIITELDKIITNSNIIGAFNFSEVSVQPIKNNNKEEDKKTKESFLQPTVDEYNNITDNTKKNIGNNKNEDENKTYSNNDLNIEQMQATLSFRGNYNSIINLIKNIESNSKKIFITNINLNQSDKNEISGSCQLEFYAIPKIDNYVEDEEYIKWNYNENYGKANPFDGGNSINISNTIEESSIIKKNSYDFVMSVRSMNSDLPTIMLGKANDNSKNTYVYADSNSKENVEIVITKENNNYYYKYKTSRGSFPIQYNGNGVKFQPLNEYISLKIYSNKRLNNDDNAGANIKIINKTDKIINVEIESDDTLNPRINISGEGSSINVKKN